MSRLSSTGVRALCALFVIMAFQSLSPRLASADVGIGLGKTVCDISISSCASNTISTSVSVVPGSRLQYNINYVNDGNVSGTITITDQIQPGQTYLASSATCVNSGGGTPLVTCTQTGVGAGSGGTVIIQTVVNNGFYGTITNMATGSTPPTLSVNSNQTTVTVATSPPPPTGVYYPPYYYYSSCYGTPYYFPNCSYNNFPCYGTPYTGNFTCSYGYPCYGTPYCSNGYPPYYNTSYVPSSAPATEVLCGVVSAYVAGAAGGTGYITVNNETLILPPGLQISGSTFTLGQSYCFTFMLASNGQVTSLAVGPNVPGTTYVCGSISQYSSGYYPYGTMPYAGYSPYPGYNPYASYSPYPGYGPYAGYGGYQSSYGWGGPMMVGGYPYQVAPNTYFPYYPQYGSNYCFLMSPQGYITGSLSAVPTAATAVTEPSGRRLPQGRGMA